MKFMVVLLSLLLFSVTASAQSITMTTAQKVQLTAAAADAIGTVVPIPQTGVTLQWTSTCPTCILTGNAYNTVTKEWNVWFNAGSDLGNFTITLLVSYNTGQKFTATQLVTINELIIIPTSVKIVPGIPINK